MSDFMQVSPLLDDMEQEETLASAEGVLVVRVRHKPTGIRYIVKKISIPRSETETEALILTGAVADAAGARAYYESVLQDYRAELTAFRKLAGSSCLAGYLRFQVAEQDSGFALYLLAPCRTSLQAYLQQNAITKLKAVQLGLDLCRALSLLRENGFLHLNLKPSNIFLEQGAFCIGDFGLFPVPDLPYGSMPPRYLGHFTAPELSNPTAGLNLTADLYAVGMLLYYIFNGSHIPFEEAGTTDKTADSRRIAGEELPTPLYADYEMDALIRKACAFRPEDRFQTPEEFLAALEDYTARNEVTDDCIVPPLCVDDVPLAAPEEDPEEAEPVVFAKPEALPQDFKESFAPTQETTAPEPPKKKKRWLLPTLLAVLLVLAAGAYYYFFEFSAVTVRSLSIAAQSPTSLTVAVVTSNPELLVVSCVAEDGSSAAAYPCAETVSFSDLQPGTVYGITVSSPDWHRVKGTTTVSAATAAMTDILSWSPTDLGNGTLQLSFQISGPEPESWTLHSQSDAAGEADYAVSDHSCTVENLLPNSEYLFTLTPVDGYYLGGTLSFSYSYALPIAGSNLALKETTENTVTVAWESDSDIATEWTVVCSGDNGYAATLVTDQQEATFEGTATDVEYTVTVQNSTMIVPLILTVQSTSTNVTAFTAALDGLSAQLAWQADGAHMPDGWIVTYAPDGSLTPKTAEAADTALTLTGLIPGAAYTFTLSAKDERMVGGETTVSAETPEAALYPTDDYGGIFIALYEVPGSNWTIKTLGSAADTFAPGAPIICAIEPSSIPAAQKASADPVSVQLVIRDSSGAPVADVMESKPWNQIWQDSVFAAEIETVPTDPGSYKLELYFDGQLLHSASFTIA